MNQRHPQARTTPQTRAAIRASALPLTELAQRYGITVATARKWKSRETTQDLSHRPHKRSTTLSQEQEAIVVALRRMLLLPLDDLLVITREFIHPAASRSGLDRCLQRHGVGSLRELQADWAAKSADGPTSLQHDEPGVFHVGIGRLPQMPDDDTRHCLFVAVDQATRWVFLRVYAGPQATARGDFLRQLSHAAPMKVRAVLTRDMDDRGNAGLPEVKSPTRFKSAEDLAATLEHCRAAYNHRIPQRAIDHRTPVQALQHWQAQRPELFHERADDLAGLDHPPAQGTRWPTSAEMTEEKPERAADKGLMPTPTPTPTSTPRVPSHSEMITTQWQAECGELNLREFLLAIYFMRLGTIVDGAFDRRCKRRYGINGGDMRVLFALRRSGPPYVLRPTDLFRALLVTSGAVTKKVDRLVSKGLAERLPDPGHNGGFLIHLTARGAQCVQETIETLAIEPSLGPAMAQFSEVEREHINGYTLRILSALEGTLARSEEDANQRRANTASR